MIGTGTSTLSAFAEATTRQVRLRCAMADKPGNYWVRFFVWHILCCWPLTQVLDGWIVGLGGGSRIYHFDIIVHRWRLGSFFRLGVFQGVEDAFV